MAILKPNQRALAGLLSLVCLAGCLITDALVEPEKGDGFSHAIHGEEQGLECVNCHAGWEDDEDPGMPRPQTCALCHADLDEEKPPERQAASFFADGEFRAAHASRQSSEIVFDHKRHATRGLECSACHADVIRDDGALADRVGKLVMSMDECIACHERSTGPRRDDCAGCHVEIRADVAPSSHHADWKRYHGTVVRGGASELVDRCELCHAPSTCVDCHSVELPLNHTNYWRRRAHGLTASMDRDSCATCHDSDSCQRCHEEIRPQSHTGNWGAPRDRHCLSCHDPVRSTTCGVCHPSTPSHAQATPLPPDHSPAMNCRLCHGNGQPLPHEDNGQACTSCHQ